MCMYRKSRQFMNWCKLVDNGEPTPYNGSKGKRLSLLNLDNLILCYLSIIGLQQSKVVSFNMILTRNINLPNLNFVKFILSLRKIILKESEVSLSANVGIFKTKMVQQVFPAYLNMAFNIQAALHGQLSLNFTSLFTLWKKLY